jgi:hypothetical protein
MRDRQTDPGERHDESSHSESVAAFRRAERDEVYEASLDSFPASDPPSWAGMRVGAPSAEPRASSPEVTR